MKNYFIGIILFFSMSSLVSAEVDMQKSKIFAEKISQFYDDNIKYQRKEFVFSQDEYTKRSKEIEDLALEMSDNRKEVRSLIYYYLYDYQYARKMHMNPDTKLKPCSTSIIIKFELAFGPGSYSNHCDRTK